jgi:alkanesulfonate monooxygenase SsuD/methylene tetrahydromethanopterin reductase-like flavin-dependent oxidoreductase (luciferase family)
VTHSLELMIAVRPTFHNPALLAKQASNIDHISNGRVSLNVMSSWWEEEARMYGVAFEKHDDRYARTSEWLDGTQLEHNMSIEEYSVSSRGLGSALVGTPAQVQEQVGRFESAGVNLLLLQFSPQFEEMERFSEAVIMQRVPALV